jgi:hypothetical protein
MASGRIEGSYGGYTVRTDWSSTIDVAGNYSTVTCNHYLICGAGWDLYIGSRSNSCDCGETKSFTSGAISTGGNSTIGLGSTTHTVYHDSDGKKTINLSTTFNIQATISGAYVASIVGSGNITLDTIPRKSVFRWMKLYPDTQMPSTKTIDDGIYVFLTKYSNNFYNKLELYYRDSSVTPKQQVLLHTYYDVNDGMYIQFTQAELDLMYRSQPKEIAAGFMAKLYTYTDNTYQTLVDPDPDTTLPVLKITQVAPTFTDFDYYDANTDAQTGTVRLTQDNQTIVKGYSSLVVSIPTSKKATANTRQTQMSHYMINGSTTPYSSNTSVTSSAFNNYSNEDVSAYAVDARGLSSNVISKSFVTLGKFVNYASIVKSDNQSYSRSNNGAGEIVTLNFSGTWWGANKFGTNANAVTNSINATYKFKKSSDSTYTTGGSTMVLTTSGTSFSFSNTVWGDLPNHGFDISESYDIIITVSDELSSADYTFNIHSGEPAIAIYRNKASLGNAYNETLGGTQLWGDVYLNGNAFPYPVNSIYESTNNTDPGTLFGGTWTCIHNDYDIIYLNSQVVYDYVEQSILTNQTIDIALQGAYTSQFYGLENGFTVPPGYTFKYRWTASIQTDGGVNVSLKVNGVFVTGEGNTWSNTAFRKTLSGGFFVLGDDITPSPTTDIGYSDDGYIHYIHAHNTVTGDVTIRVWDVTMHLYAVSNDKIYRWKRIS